MKKIYSSFVALLFSSFAFAQICSPVANLILFSNYDGGTLNINLNAPMGPGIKIGVCTYEGVNIVVTPTQLAILVDPINICRRRSQLGQFDLLAN